MFDILAKKDSVQQIKHFKTQVSRRSVPIEVCGSPLISRHRLVPQAQGEAASNISSSFTSSATLPGSPLRSSSSVLASLDKSILQIR